MKTKNDNKDTNDFLYDDLDEHYTESREQNYVKALKIIEKCEINA